MNVLKADASLADASLQQNLASPAAPWYVQCDIAIPAATLATLVAASDNSADLLQIGDAADGIAPGFPDGVFVEVPGNQWWTDDDSVGGPYGVVTPDEWHTVAYAHVGSDVTFAVDDVLFSTYPLTIALDKILVGAINGLYGTGSQIYYVKDVRVGTTLGGTDIFADDFSSGDLSAWDVSSGSATVVPDPITVAAYATTDEFFRIIKKNTPSADQVAAAQGDLDTATLEINAELDWADDHEAMTAQELTLVKGVCLDRAADLWRHRESAPGILGVVDEGVPSTPGRYSFARYVARLSPLKDQWGVA